MRRVSHVCWAVFRLPYLSVPRNNDTPEQRHGGDCGGGCQQTRVILRLLHQARAQVATEEPRRKLRENNSSRGGGEATAVVMRGFVGNYFHVVILEVLC